MSTAKIRKIKATEIPQHSLGPVSKYREYYAAIDALPIGGALEIVCPCDKKLFYNAMREHYYSKLSKGQTSIKIKFSSWRDKVYALRVA